mmetsp:Transcript_21088/g.37752  ORF Transcript_21088/g.37752 Transcript_21088/m.37752 type:complete len:212 (+) Transcript_21088:2209-2844(+)
MSTCFASSFSRLASSRPTFSDCRLSRIAFTCSNSNRYFFDSTRRFRHSFSTMCMLSAASRKSFNSASMAPMLRIASTVVLFSSSTFNVFIWFSCRRREFSPVRTAFCFMTSPISVSLTSSISFCFSSSSNLVLSSLRLDSVSACFKAMSCFSFCMISKLFCRWIDAVSAPFSHTALNSLACFTASSAELSKTFNLLISFCCSSTFLIASCR